MHPLTIITRRSTLALWQANHVRSALLQHYPALTINIVGIKTSGDLWLDTPLQKIGGKGLFVKELEQALLSKEADIAVHSLKDMPSHFPEGLGFGAICQRDDPFDAWICPKGFTIDTIPAGATIGTSSLRRVAQLKIRRPDLHYAPLRGNIDTRLRHCFEGKWDAIVLAIAGLQRLGLQEHATTIFTPQEVLPAVGQGALAIECRLQDDNVRALLSVLEHAPTRACVEAERAMNAALGGNCQIPIAGFAEHKEGTLQLTGLVADPDHLTLLRAQHSHNMHEPEVLGQKVARDLIAQGALSIIARLRDA